MDDFHRPSHTHASIVCIRDDAVITVPAVLIVITNCCQCQGLFKLVWLSVKTVYVIMLVMMPCSYLLPSHIKVHNLNSCFGLYKIMKGFHYCHILYYRTPNDFDVLCMQLPLCLYVVAAHMGSCSLALKICNDICVTLLLYH